MLSLTGRYFGDYLILEKVGRGGMATVYRARDRRTNQDVAIKFISPALAENEQFIRRFRREVKMVARLDHPNIVPVLDYGEKDGYAYQVMPFLEVGSLTDRMLQGSVSLQVGGKLLDQVATALAYSHQHGVVHRDVKPSNILLDPEGNALLADFGMARQVEASESLTGSAVIGTPAYIAPEQVQGGNVDARCDQYALGVLLFQLATGTLPYEAETPIGVLLKHVNEPFPAARERNAQVPETIEQVILKATAKDPQDRFANISDMNGALQAALAFVRDPISNEMPTIQLPDASGKTAVKTESPFRRRPLRVGAVAALVLLFLLAIPVFASGLVDLLNRASSPAEGSLLGPSIELTAQAATIEAMSTELARSGSGSADDIATAVAQTLTAANAQTIGSGGGTSVPEAESEVPSSGSALLQSPSPSASSPTAPVASPTSSLAADSEFQNPTQSASSSTPVPSPVPSATAPPSSTPTQTATTVPTATFTQSPVPTPSATEDSCPLITLGGFGVSGDRVSWTIANGSSTVVNLTRIVLDWPAANGTLDRIRFNGSSIWNGDDEAPPSDVSTELSGNRKLNGGASKELAFEFTSTTQLSGYDVQVYLDIDCQRSAGG